MQFICFQHSHAQYIYKGLLDTLRQADQQQNGDMPDRLIFSRGSESFYMKDFIKMVDNGFDQYGHAVKCREIWVNIKATEGKDALFRKNRITYLKLKKMSTKKYNKYISSLVRYRFNCVDNILMVMEVYDYNSDGSVILESKENSPWESIIPGSIGERLKRFVCD
jgi:hypothetical protein